MMGMRSILFAAGLLLTVAMGPSQSRAANNLSVTRFRDHFVEELRKADSKLKLKLVGQDQVDVVEPDGETSSTYLDNAYNRYLEHPDELDEIIARFVRLALDAGVSSPISADTLLVLIRPASYLQTVNPGPSKAGDKPPPMTRPFAGDLLLFIAVDGAESIEFPSASELHKALGDGDDRIWSAARSSVALRRGDAQTDMLRKGLVVVETNASMASSLLVDGTLLELPQVKALGPRVVVLIGKDSVAVAQEDDPAAVAGLHDLADKFPADWVSDRLYVPSSDGGWREYTE
jgi:hypothetical protein